jgi:hypothetical protein
VTTCSLDKFALIARQLSGWHRVREPKVAGVNDGNDELFGEARLYDSLDRHTALTDAFPGKACHLVQSASRLKPADRPSA